MFSKNARQFVKDAVDAETDAAVSRWGETYNSCHEGYAVLKEEVEESEEALNGLKEGLAVVWGFVREEHNACCWKYALNSMGIFAEQLALEAVQVAAVCKKFLKTVPAGVASEAEKEGGL